MSDATPSMATQAELTVLVAEEDPATRAFLVCNLQADRFTVIQAASRDSALTALNHRRPDVAVVDVNGRTLSLIDAVRSRHGVAASLDPDVPMLVLSADANVLHRVRLLERGGDDVMRKPFAYSELRARILALHRRACVRRNPRVLAAGPVRIDLAAREVIVEERRVALSQVEFGLLRTLAGDPSRVFTRGELLHEVWGYPAGARTRTLDSHASRLRRKLKDAGAHALVQNVWGVGYRLKDPEFHPMKDRSLEASAG